MITRALRFDEFADERGTRLAVGQCEFTGNGQ